VPIAQVRGVPGWRCGSKCKLHRPCVAHQTREIVPCACIGHQCIDPVGQCQRTIGVHHILDARRKLHEAGADDGGIDATGVLWILLNLKAPGPDEIGVVASVSGHLIVAAAPIQRVVALVTDQDVVSHATIQHVMALATIQPVVAIATVQHIAGVVTRQAVVVGTTKEGVIAVGAL